MAFDDLAKAVGAFEEHPLPILQSEEGEGADRTRGGAGRGARVRRDLARRGIVVRQDEDETLVAERDGRPSAAAALLKRVRSPAEADRSRSPG
jgi:hypothetical protein